MVSFLRTGSAMSDHPTHERTSERKPVRMSATCRAANGLRDEGTLEDISAVGCCFVSRGTCFKIGSHVILRPQGLEGITGTVRWVRANRFGIEFTSPLYGAVLDHLCNRFGSEAASAPAAPPAPGYAPRPLPRRMF